MRTFICCLSTVGLIAFVKGNCKCQFILRLVVLLINVSYLYVSWEVSM